MSRKRKPLTEQVESVAQLIHLLQQFNPKAPVVVWDGETFSPITAVIQDFPGLTEEDAPVEIQL